MSRPIPLYAKASFLITSAEFREINRLPAVYYPRDSQSTLDLPQVNLCVKKFLSVRNIYNTEFNSEAAPKLLVSFMERTLVETTHEIRNGLIKFVFFSRRCICKTLRMQYNYHFRRFYFSLNRVW